MSKKIIMNINRLFFHISNKINCDKSGIENLYLKKYSFSTLSFKLLKIIYYYLWHFSLDGVSYFFLKQNELIYWTDLLRRESTNTTSNLFNNKYTEQPIRHTTGSKTGHVEGDQ